MRPRDSAFPLMAATKTHVGLTVRDHLAALAMQGFIASGEKDPDEVAKRSYEMADKMIRFSEKTG